MEQESLGWSAAAAALPDADTLRRLAKSEPFDLSAAELIDFIVCAERLQSFVQALQISAVAEFARPGRCGDVSDLVDMLTEKGGRAKLSDGSIDVDVLEALVQEQTRRLAAAEIAAALRQSSIGAARRVDAALEYADELPATLRALREGRIDKARAWVIADRTGNLDPDLRNELESSIVPLAFDRTPGQLKPLVDRRVVAADPDAAKKRAEKARKERTVDHFPGDDGMGVIRAILSADGAVAVAELLDSMARATAGADDRPIAARRADALTDICISLLQDGFVDVGVVLGKVSDCGASESRTDAESFEEAGDAIVRNPGSESEELSDEHDAAYGNHVDGLSDGVPREGIADNGSRAAGIFRGPTRSPAESARIRTHHGRETHFNLTMSAAAFAALSESPAELVGHGCITADIARMMAESLSSLAVIVVNGAGQATAVGSTTYAARQTIADRVIAAAGTCRFPSCRQTAHKCDLDHRQPFDHDNPARGGSTEMSNLDPLCRNHHLLKTHAGWRAARDPEDGLTLSWISPTGHRYVSAPRQFQLADEAAMPDERRCGVTRDGHRGSASGSRYGAGTAEREHAEACADALPVPFPVETGSGNADLVVTVRRLLQRAEKDRIRATTETAMVRPTAVPHLTFTLGVANGRIPPRSYDDSWHEDEDAHGDDDHRSHEECADGYEPPTQAFLRRFCTPEIVQGHSGTWARNVKLMSGSIRPDPEAPPF